MRATFSDLSRSTWKILIQLPLLWISYQAIVDTQVFPAHSIKWKAAGFLVAGTIILGNLIFSTLLFFKFGDVIRRGISRIPPAIRIASVILVNILPGILLIYTNGGNYLTGAYLRIMIYLFVSAATTLLLFPVGSKWQLLQGFLLSFGLSGFIYSIFVNLNSVRTTPFSIGWSEGNRFYDYSLIFGKKLYDYAGNLTVPYNSPGRYALWGSLFLIPGLPIWAHRLWDALLWVGTPLALTGVLAWNIKKPLLRWGLTLWGAIFIMQGPVYPHLLVPMILLALFMRSDKFWLKLLAGAAISYYAGMSRFTWAVLPGVWLVLYDLVMDYPKREGSWIKRLTPPALLGLAGILPGLIGTWAGNANPIQGLTFSQPLLLYRLFPNSTYGQGILLGAAITFLPVMILLAWIVITGKWKVNLLAKAAMLVSLAGFLVLGLIASTKIGGGSNLHNLDMFILTLVFLTILAVTQMQLEIELNQARLPQWILIALLVIAAMPGWLLFQSGHPYHAEDMEIEVKTLSTIQKDVNNAKSQGEVLFIDQRQLLTFGYITDVPLVPDYEKKYMMDQAMGGNQQYFDLFYQDLKNKRFQLIVSDVQKTQFQEQNEGFSEENNAFVRWVSIPLLKYYKPVITIRKLGIQLLVPR